MRFLNSLAVLALIAIGALGSTPARADTILFDPNGTAGATSLAIGQFDQAPGNALAVNAISNGSVIANTPFTLLYQARIGTLRDANNQTAAVPGLTTNGELTIVAQFNEVATTTGGGLNASFSTNTNQANSFVRIFFDAARNSNDLTGTGFNDGVLVYEGRVLPTGGGSFSVTSTTPVALDQSPNGNQYPGVQSVTGAGGTQISVATVFANPNFFLNQVNALAFSFNTSNVTPFNEVDPAATMFNGQAGVASVGAINGVSGPNFLFQSDSTASFRVVPEPASLAMLAFGGACTLTVFRRRKAQTIA